MGETVQVTMMVTYPSPVEEGFHETTWHSFLDVSPEFPGTNSAIETYQDITGAKIDIWYNDYEPVLKEPTHRGNLTIQ